jgi:hypothetical protein
MEYSGYQCFADEETKSQRDKQLVSGDDWIGNQTVVISP